MEYTSALLEVLRYSAARVPPPIKAMTPHWPGVISEPFLPEKKINCLSTGTEISGILAFVTTATVYTVALKKLITPA